MSRTIKTSSDIVLSQNEDDLAVILDNSIEYDMLKDEVANGLMPIGTVMALMPHLAGTYQPGISGAVKDGLMLCDGAAIPAGNSLVGTTPNINNNSYLRGASSSDNTIFSSNDRSLSVPELPLHSHPVSITDDLATHNHLITVDAANAPHAHPVTISTADTNHIHPATSTSTTNVPHNHPATDGGVSNAPHSHSHTSTPGGSHGHGGTSFGANAPHTHPLGFTYTSSGPGIRRDLANTSQGASGRWYTGSATGASNAPHSHPSPNSGASNNPHSHPRAIGTANFPHRHTTPAWNNANAPHSHTTGIGTTSALHTHPISVTNDSMVHTHTSTVDLDNAPHNHPGTITGGTGSGDTMSFEPNYIDCVYVIRVI